MWRFLIQEDTFENEILLSCDLTELDLITVFDLFIILREVSNVKYKRTDALSLWHQQ